AISYRYPYASCSAVVRGFAISQCANPLRSTTVPFRLRKLGLPGFVSQSLRWKTTLWIVLTLAIALSGYVALEISAQQRRQRADMEKRGRIMAQFGAQAASSARDEAIRSGALPRDQVFDTKQTPVPNSNPPLFDVSYQPFTQRAFADVWKQYMT